MGPFCCLAQITSFAKSEILITNLLSAQILIHRLQKTPRHWQVINIIETGAGESRGVIPLLKLPDLKQWCSNLILISIHLPGSNGVMLEVFQLVCSRILVFSAKKQIIKYFYSKTYIMAASGHGDFVLHTRACKDKALS